MNERIDFSACLLGVNSWFNLKTLKLSLLCPFCSALGFGAPQVYGLARPREFAASVKKFPRNLGAGIVLMLLGTAWFVWNVNNEPIADFSAFKPYMMGGFSAIGVLSSCIFIQDFLAVRGLAVVFLLLGKLMVDTGRPHLGESPFSGGDSGLGLRSDPRRNLVHHHALEIAGSAQLCHRQ